MAVRDVDASLQRPAWRVQVVSLFPELFPGPLAASIVGHALEQRYWEFESIDLRAFGLGKHAQVDDSPAGGGPGMVLRCDVVGAAIDAARAQQPHLPAIYLSPRGEPFTQDIAREWAAGPGVLMMAGRFEGVDQRAIDARHLREISIGDYVLSGGEIAAMVIIDACVRLLPGVLGAQESLARESFDGALLEYPQYTRPRAWEGHDIPEPLLSGDHRRIADWRQNEAETLTRVRRPDLWAKYQPRGTQKAEKPK